MSIDPANEAMSLVRSNPIDLQELEGCLYISKGTVQIFLVEKPKVVSGDLNTAAVPESGRKFLFELSAGSIALGGQLAFAQSQMEQMAIAQPDMSLFGEEVTLIAVGGHDTKVTLVTGEQWAEKLRDMIGVSRLINTIDHWVGSLLGSAGDLLPRPPEFQALASSTHTEQVNAGGLFSARHEIVWVEQAHAPHLLFETIAVDSVTFVPVNERSWYMATDNIALSTSTTGALLQADRLWGCLEAFQVAILAFLPETLRLMAGDEANRVRESERRGAALSSDAFVRLEDAVGASIKSSQRTNAEPLQDGLELVCSQLCAALKISYRPVRVEAGSAMRARTLDEILDANTFRLREVKLVRGWAKQDSGPLLFIDGETGKPFALLPTQSKGISSSRFSIFDPATGKSSSLSNRQADTLQGFAYMLYPPLSDAPLTAKQFVMRIFDNRMPDLLVIASMSLIGGTLSLGIPITVGYLVDEVIPNGDLAKLSELLLILMAVGVCIILSRYASQIATLRMEGWAGGRLEAGVIDRVLRLPIPILRQYSSGDLASRASVVRNIEQVFTGALINVLLGGIFALFSIALLFAYSVPLAFVAVIFCCLIFAINFGLGWLSISYERNELEREGMISGALFQTVLGLEKIRLSASEVPRFHQWAGEYANLTRNMITSRKIQMVSNITVQSATIAGMVLIFGSIHALGLSNGSMTIGSIAAFLAAFSSALAGLLGISGVLLSLMGLKPVFDHGRPILEASPEPKGEGAAVETLTGRIELDQICYTYPDTDQQILNGVTMAIEPGQSVGVVGSSGSGKSTLVRLLLAFDQPSQGSVLYNGRALEGLDKNGVRRQIGVVLQEGRLMAGSILENIRGGNGQISEEDAWEAARHVAFDDDIRNMPMGMQTLIGDKAALSGGQVQRLLIARALVNKPRILILDEATSALDNTTQRVVGETLNHLGVTRISIAHRISTIRDCDVIYVMDKGRVVEKGDYDDLIAANGLFTELASRQTSV